MHKIKIYWKTTRYLWYYYFGAFLLFSGDDYVETSIPLAASDMNFVVSVPMNSKNGYIKLRNNNHAPFKFN